MLADKAAAAQVDASCILDAFLDRPVPPPAFPLSLPTLWVAWNATWPVMPARMMPMKWAILDLAYLMTKNRDALKAFRVSTTRCVPLRMPCTHSARLAFRYSLVGVPSANGLGRRLLVSR